MNASAGFRRGLWSMIVGDDLVLTIGLPLAAGMNLQQLAAVLAHEFGHFGQGLGMRMTYLIRAINFWFTRVVYQRNQWDAWLQHTSSSINAQIGIVLLFARFLVWCTRRIFWALMMIGHVVAGYMLRQMEFDADRYETRFGGVATFEQNHRLGTELSAAYDRALAALAKFYREGRLGDNLPRLVAVNASQMPDDVRQTLQRLSDQATTRLLDTHPCPKDRIANARQEGAPGIFHTQRPASVLFTDFDDVCRKATWDFYRGIFGSRLKPTDMHSINPLVARQEEDVARRKALDRFFQGTFSPLRMASLPADLPERDSDPKAIVAALLRQSPADVELAPTYRDGLAAYWQHDGQVVEAERAKALLRAGVKIKPREFSVPLINHARRAWVWLAPQSGAEYVGESPAGA